MTEIIGVRFKNTGKIYYFAPKGMKFEVGDVVIVDSAYGLEIGRVATANKEVDDSEITPPLRSVNRAATTADLEIDAQNRVKEKNAMKVAKDLIAVHGLEMKLVDAEFSFGGNRLSFYFTADGRVDFRELVKSLAGVFKTRIELRQIGVRDEAKLLGAIGSCGRTLCCSTFLDSFHPVSIKMAKEQGLSPNPTKVSGLCGRLMCCLQYEQLCYEEMLKIMPVVGATVATPHGRGTVVYTEVLNGRIKVCFESDGGFNYYDVKDIQILDNTPRRKRNAAKAADTDAQSGEKSTQSADKNASKEQDNAQNTKSAKNTKSVKNTKSATQGGEKPAHDKQIAEDGEQVKKKRRRRRRKPKEGVENGASHAAGAGAGDNQ